MSFSHLTPRNNRQRIAPTGVANKRHGQPARHLRLWEAIRLTRSELSDVQQRTALIDTLFRHYILPRETQLTSTHGELTDRLMDTYTEGCLDRAEQALLNLWISDNLRSLTNHPFAADEQRDSLNRRWQQLLLAETGKSPPRTQLDDLFDDELDDDDEVFDFGWHGGTDRSAPEPNPKDKTAPDSAADTSRDNTCETSTDSNADTHTGQAPDNSARLHELEQKLSVERLFRQLARTLHPDLEQDETRKAEKHELMSECLIARQNKDINTLLTLYCEHVGELPDDLDGNEHEELIQALEQQLRQLQAELRQARFGSPLHVQIVERYSANDEETTRRRVLQHADSLDTEVSRLQSQMQRLNSEEGLLAELADRREIEQNRMIIDSMTGYSPSR